MSEEATVQEAPQVAEGTRSPVEKPISVEVTPESQEVAEESNSEINQLIAESKKYRKRSQSAEAELAKLQKQIASDREKQMEEQQEWQQLAEERALRIAELEPIVEQARNDESQMREKILSDFSEEDRETFGDLPLSKLRALHDKLNNNNNRTPVANNPAVPANEVPQDWTSMNRNQRAKNWDKIIASYRRTPPK
jgi:DNA repair exonuclease SbcCD ATPase subunit